MRGVGKDVVIMAKRRQDFLEAAFRLFSTKNIETVSLQDIANETDHGIATLYRYFSNKPALVIETAAWKWSQFWEVNISRRHDEGFSGMTASQIFEFYLESFLVLYRDHSDILRFNQFFNVYIQAEHIGQDLLKPYLAIIEDLHSRFRTIYAKALEDHTLRTDESEEKMFSKTLHLMLAVVTRYAVGLVYTPEKGFDALEELEFQKNMILSQYRNV